MFHEKILKFFIALPHVYFIVHFYFLLFYFFFFLILFILIGLKL